MRMLITPVELSQMPVFQALQSQIAALPPGALDSMLDRASARCESFCDRRLLAPQKTILTVAANPGDTAISVMSTNGIDFKEEQGVILGVGGTQEILDIAPGGVTLNSVVGVNIAPYPGTLTLTTPLAYPHSIGETVQCVWREVRQAGGTSSDDLFDNSLITQEAQMAAAHMPPLTMQLTRSIFLRSYPIQTLYAIDHAYSWTNLFHAVNISVAAIEAAEGVLRLNVGSVITQFGLIRTTYTGGYNVVPSDIKQAVMFYIRDELTGFLNPYGLTEVHMGKRTQKFGYYQKKSYNVIQAEEILSAYKRLV